MGRRLVDDVSNAIKGEAHGNHEYSDEETAHARALLRHLRE